MFHAQLHYVAVLDIVTCTSSRNACMRLVEIASRDVIGHFRDGEYLLNNALPPRPLIHIARLLRPVRHE